MPALDPSMVTTAVLVTTIQCSDRWLCICSDSCPPGLTTIRLVWKSAPASVVSYVPHGRWTTG